MAEIVCYMHFPLNLTHVTTLPC